MFALDRNFCPMDRNKQTFNPLERNFLWFLIWAIMDIYRYCPCWIGITCWPLVDLSIQLKQATFIKMNVYRPLILRRSMRPRQRPFQTITSIIHGSTRNDPYLEDRGHLINQVRKVGINAFKHLEIFRLRVIVSRSWFCVVVVFLSISPS